MDSNDWGKKAGKITQLEDILAWQEARKLMKVIYDITLGYPKSEEFNLKKHMKECSRNIPGNIGEGFGRFNYQECLQFYRIARGSLNELKSDVYCSSDQSYINQSQLDATLAQIQKVEMLLNGLIKSTSLVKRTK